MLLQNKPLLACLIAGLSALASGDAPAAARVGQHEVEACLELGRSQYADNANVLQVLQRSRVHRDSVRIERYDGSIGKQRISSIIDGKLHTQNEYTGRFECITDEDGTPVFFRFQPID